MVLPIGDRRPFSMPYVIHNSNIGSGAMVSRAPWPSPVNKYYVIRKLLVTAPFPSPGLSGGVLNIWDQDTSNTTPATRGSAGGPLLVVPVTPVSVSQNSGVSVGSTMTVLDIDAMPMENFYAGISIGTTAQSSGCAVSIEVDVI